MTYDLTEAREALLFALETEPDLILNGYPYAYRADEKFKRLQYIHENRAEMFKDFSLEQIATALAWIDVTPKTKTPNHNSYAAKHAAERWGRENGLCPYVANGALIAAAIYRGVPVKRLFGSPNAMLGLTTKSVAAKAA